MRLMKTKIPSWVTKIAQKSDSPYVPVVQGEISQEELIYLVDTISKHLVAFVNTGNPSDKSELLRHGSETNLRTLNWLKKTLVNSEV